MVLNNLNCFVDLGILMSNFFKLTPSKQRRLYWVISLLVGFLPCILRYAISLDHAISGFDIKDLLFAGLSMNLANFSQMSNDRFEAKEVLALISVLLIVVIAAFLSVFLMSEVENQVEPIFLFYISFLPVLLSALFNFQAHHYD